MADNPGRAHQGALPASPSGGAVLPGQRWRVKDHHQYQLHLWFAWECWASELRHCEGFRAPSYLGLPR